MTPPLAGSFDARAREPLSLAGAEARSGTPVCRLEGWLTASSARLAPGNDLPERLAAAYRRWGSGLVERLRGEFALLLWDAEHREGLLAGDALGVRTIYYAEQGGAVWFASELRELLRLLPSAPALDEASVAHWLAGSVRPGPFTLYEGVRRLHGGRMLVLADGRAHFQTFWRPRYRPFGDMGRKEAVSRVRAGLRGAVGERLDPTGTTAVLMSGGLDSGSVAALAAPQAPGRVRAYAGVFPEFPSLDESALIAKLRARLRLPGLDAEVGAGGLVASAREWAAECGVPQLGWSDGWTVPLLRAAAEDGARVVLGGDGGDELFGAQTALIADALRGLRPLEALALARELPGAGDRPPRREVAGVLWRLGVMDARPRWLAAAGPRLRPASGLPPWLLPPTARLLRDSDDPLAWTRLSGPRWWAYAAHGLSRGIAERGVFEHQRLRGGLAGVDARHPLLDLDLLELVLSLPPRLAFDRNLSRPLLREALAGSLPEDVRLRPGKAWFDELVIASLTGPDAPAVHELLVDSRPELGAYVRPAQVRELLERGPPPGAGRFAWMHAVWRLVSAECWLRSLTGRPVPCAPAPRVRLRSVAGGLREASSVFQP